MWSKDRFSISTTTTWSIPQDLGAGRASPKVGRVAATAAVPSSSWRRDKDTLEQRLL